jgi:tRNA(Ile)-lysidine synthase
VLWDRTQLPMSRCANRPHHAMTPASLPIADSELGPLFAPLECCDVIVLAVSGGADSTALMHLAARWRRMRASGPALHVATVDHALRAGSRIEAEAVGAVAAALGVPHHLLTWGGRKPASALQAAAREARYALLADLLDKLGGRCSALVTGHTADDQAETLLMRLARGSGLDGLSAMPPQRLLHRNASHQLVRPLLAVPRQRLVATLQAEGIDWSEDPSNANAAFERVRLREASATLAVLGLGASPLTTSAARLQRARSALDWATSEFETRVLDVNAGAFAAIDRAGFAAAPAELRLRLLSRVLARFGGCAPPPRLARVEALLGRLAGNQTLTATLGGCVLTAKAGAMCIFREPGRRSLPEFVLAGADARPWDERFLVSARLSDPVTVRALGPQTYAGLRSSLSHPLPARVAATLPSFWQGKTLLAVPHLALSAGILPQSAGSFRADFLGLPADQRICD